MCPKSSKPTGDPVDPDKKVTDESSKLGSATKPTLKVISVDQELPVTSDVSVKAITIPSVGKLVTTLILYLVTTTGSKNA